MTNHARIYIAGHRGLVGSAIVRKLRAQGYDNLLLRTHAELDLANQKATDAFFAEETPEYVFLAAAKVGGILANNTRPAEFIHENLAIQTNVIDAAYRNGVKRLLFLGSSCIYPRDCPQPIKEEYLLTGPLEPTNRPYALAKIAGIEMCWSYNRQYGTKYLSVMPTNLYGPGDNYDLDSSHVIPALIRKFHEARISGASEVVVWGTGTPRREFLYSDDMADACVYLMTQSDAGFDNLLQSFGDKAPLINIGAGEDITIAELAQMIAKVVEYDGEIVFDTSKPDGTMRKLMDNSFINALGWRNQMPLRSGLKQAYQNFLNTKLLYK
ncbi:MAG: GDP-L-fucose synthase [Zoogloeaceae bacterium]|jgi:GDP-L-fucose synthase|nr:GDP-L-fucose synthase [Zoogloeaceae bacterium]